jgi:hypothetical protein
MAMDDLPGLYAPPTARPEHRPRAPGALLKLPFVAMLALYAIACVLLIVPRFPSAVTWTASTVAGLTPRVCNLLGWAWVYLAWKGVPTERRAGLTPRSAFWRCIVPVYNLYWRVEFNRRLVEALDDTLARSGESRRAPRLWAKIAPWTDVICSLANLLIWRAGERASYLGWVAGIALTVGPDVLWSIYMFKCDDARQAVTDVTGFVDRESRLGWISLVPVALVVLLFLAIWQFLSPR